MGATNMPHLVGQYTVVCYVLFWVSRVRGVVRRRKQPFLRGNGWFFNVPVQPGFYAGPGAGILRRYRVRMAWPFLLDLPVVAAAVALRRTDLLLWLMVAQVALIHGNHLLNVAAAERRARSFTVLDEARPAGAVGVSLTPRRLRDFTNTGLEWAMGVATVLAFVALLSVYRRSVGAHTVRQVFWVPVFYLYLQLGVLFVKQVIVGWRSPVPVAQTEEHLRAQEVLRSYYLRMCDWNRIVSTAGICFWPILLSVPAMWFALLTKAWLWTWLGLCVAGSIWVEVLRKRIAEVQVRARPVQMPDLMGAGQRARWPLCFEPAAPLPIVKGMRGYSLNLAHTVSYVGAGYLLGMAALLHFARMGR